jgi:hypothetical protein
MRAASSLSVEARKSASGVAGNGAVIGAVYAASSFSRNPS